MNISLKVTDLTKEKQKLLDSVTQLENSSDEEKVLALELDSTIGSIPDSLEVIQRIHTSESNIILKTDSIGELSPAGLLIGAAGKPKFRTAKYTTMFRLKEDLGVEDKKKKNSDPFETVIIATLCAHGGRKAKLLALFKNQSIISALDAKSCGIIDDAGVTKSRYKSEDKDNKKK